MKIPLLSGALPVFTLCVLAGCTADVRAEQLKSPWDARSVALTDAAHTCPDPPPFSKSLDAESYYIDAHHSIIDPA